MSQQPFSRRQLEQTASRQYRTQTLAPGLTKEDAEE